MSDQVTNCGEIVNNLTKSEKDNLFELLVSNQMDKYFSEMKRLKLSGPVQTSDKLPVFIHYQNESKFTFYSKQAISLVDFFKFLPFSDLRASFETISSSIQEKNSSESLASEKIIQAMTIQGVKLNLDQINPTSSLAYFFENCLSLDNLLHVCLF